MRLLIIGSSIMQLWPDPAAAFPQVAVRNAAIGGTTTGSWRELAGAVFAAEPADAVLLYAGSNDLNLEIDPAVIIANTLAIRARLPVSMAWLGILRCPQKMAMVPQIALIQQSVAAQLPDGDLIVDGSPALADGDRYNPACFLDDGLHLTGLGYRQLEAVIVPPLRAWLVGLQRQAAAG